jgi:hypothetical protein
MVDASTHTGLSRRRLLAGGLAGAGAVALAGCITDPDPPDAVPGDEVWVARVGRVPFDDPSSDAWKRTTPTAVVMDAQTIALPHRPTPVVPEIAVRAVHDGASIAFRLDWDDPDHDDLTVQVDGFRDACAVLLGPGAGDQAIRVMGSAETPVVLLHWKADWQRDMEQGVQGEAEVYPNRSVDVYPPLLLEVPRDVTADDYRAADATEWLPGLHVGNVLSADTRATCVEKLLAAGFGTSTTAATQDARGRGERGEHGWHVVLSKPLAGTEGNEPALEPGRSYTCAFALWSGSARDAGGRKTPSLNAFRLSLEA